MEAEGRGVAIEAPPSPMEGSVAEGVGSGSSTMAPAQGSSVGSGSGSTQGSSEEGSEELGTSSPLEELDSPPSEELGGSEELLGSSEEEEGGSGTELLGSSEEEEEGGSGVGGVGVGGGVSTGTWELVSPAPGTSVVSLGTSVARAGVAASTADRARAPTRAAKRRGYFIKQFLLPLECPMRLYPSILPQNPLLRNHPLPLSPLSFEESLAKNFVSRTPL